MRRLWMSLDPPQKNVPLTERGDMMSLETYLLLQAIYDRLTQPQTSFNMLSPNGTEYVITVSNAGALVVTAA